MDPQTTWDELLAAYADGDWDNLEELALALRGWLRKDGFPPTVLGIPGVDSDFDRALATAACDFVLEVLHSRWSANAMQGETE